ncbi:MAG: hypothetical protein ABSG18_22975 [Steroidobacteraceae bacterium]|jgi:hypothetical protein
MARNFAFICGLFAAAGTGAAAQTTVITRSNNGTNHAEIIQSGPSDEKPSVKVRKGPGFVVIEQHSNNNSAVVIQGD